MATALPVVEPRIQCHYFPDTPRIAAQKALATVTSLMGWHSNSPPCENKGRGPISAMGFISAISHCYALFTAAISALSIDFISCCICGNHNTRPGHVSVQAASYKCSLIIFKLYVYHPEVFAV